MGAPMATAAFPERILSLMARLRAAHSDAIVCLDEIQQLLLPDAASAGFEQVPGTNSRTIRPDVRLRIDEQTWAITWRGTTCYLGPGICFRFFLCLARHLDHRLTYGQLLTAVWDDQPRSDCALRTVVRDLRRRFREAGMPELADSIRGQARTYGLLLGRRA